MYEMGMVVARVVNDMKTTNDQTLRTLSVIEANLMRRDLDTTRVDVVVCLVRTLETDIKRMQEQLAGLPAELDPPVAPGTGS
jgi:hypothetical protein